MLHIPRRNLLDADVRSVVHWTSLRTLRVLIDNIHHDDTRRDATMVITTTLHPTVARARLVSPSALPMMGNWRDGTTAPAAPKVLASFATNAYGVETIRGNCQVDGAKRFTTRPSRPFASRST